MSTSSPSSISSAASSCAAASIAAQSSSSSTSLGPGAPGPVPNAACLAGSMAVVRLNGKTRFSSASAAMADAGSAAVGRRKARV